jgi:hypothetical protein
VSRILQELITLLHIKSVSHLLPPSSVGLQERTRDGFVPGFFNPLSYTNLIALLIVGLLIREVNVVFSVLVSTVPESARFSNILMEQRTLQELVNIEKLLSVHLIPEIQSQTCKN